MKIPVFSQFFQDRCFPRSFHTAAFCTLFLAIPALSDEGWYQYQGPQRDRISLSVDWNAHWPPEGPTIAWKSQIGTGFSSISVRNGRVFTMGNQGNEDIVWCLDEKTGDVVWTFRYPCELFPNMHEGGPGGTPTVSEDCVYTVSKDGQMYCLDVKTGKKVWFQDLKQLLQVEMPRWRFSNSPLLEEGKLIIDVGTIAALNPATGEIIWKTKNYGSAYSSAIAFSVHGKRCIAAFPATGLVLLDAQTGKELSTYLWPTRYGINAATPLVQGNQIFISSGYEMGGALLEIDSNFQLQERWKNRNMGTQMNSCIYHDGYLYGFDESILKCIDFQTGEEKWRQRGLGKGSLLRAGNRLVILGERGALIIAEAVPDAYREISQTQVLSGRCWTLPVLADQKIFCRNAAGDFVCVDVSKPS